MLLDYRVLIVGSPGKSRQALVRMVQRLGCQVVGSGMDQLAQFYAGTLTADLLLVEGRTNFRQTAQRVKAEHLAPVFFYQTQEMVPGEKWGLLFRSNAVEDGRWKSAMAIAVEKYDRKADCRDSRDQLNSAAATRMMVAKAQSCLVREKGISEMQSIYQMQVLSQKMGISLRQMAQRIFSAGLPVGETA